MAIQPIFLFSVSRSGSTLVQRVIAAHDGVATAAEPWLLLPHAYSLRSEGVRGEYHHPLLATAISDFCKELPDGIEDYRRESREFALRLYAKAAGDGARWFLDKSPSYYLVAEEVMRLFPEGKFVFLWRNPLSVMASIIETFNGGRWAPSVCRGDLSIGLPRLLSAFQASGGRAHSVRFEDLIDGGERPWRELMAYLGIEFDRRALHSFAEVELRGRMGDPTGVHEYSKLTSEPAGKWRRVLANPLRRAWSRRYLEFLGRERLALMGYDEDELRAELAATPRSMRSLAPDLGRLVVDVAKEPVRARIRRDGVGGPNVIGDLMRAESRSTHRRTDAAGPLGGRSSSRKAIAEAPVERRLPHSAMPHAGGRIQKN
ncbi:MAG TPA: sulfotransferase [Solirubrobacteraceae bacterium]|nr:sulfotransferase [Solirubrobacteraceae bacterium]